MNFFCFNFIRPLENDLETKEAKRPTWLNSIYEKNNFRPNHSNKSCST